MPAALPPEIDVVTTATGERYEMPARQIGCVKVVAIPMVVIGLVFLFAGCYTSFIEGGLWGLIRGWIDGSTAGVPVDVVMALFGLPFIASGFGSVYLGVMLFGGHSVIELRDDCLIATQRSGPFRWRRKIPLNRIGKLQVKSANADESAVVIGAALSALNVVTPGGRMYNLAWGYPKVMLRKLANHLSARCESVKGARLIEDGAGIEVEETLMGQDQLADAVEQAEGQGRGLEDEGIPPQPAGSTIFMETHDAGITVTVPPVGIRKGGKGMFGFSVFWNGFMVVFTAGWFSSGVKGVSDLLIVLGFLTLFWSIGIWMLVASINAGRRRAILDVVGDTLLITRKNIFKTRQQEVARDNIQSIRRDKSGVEVNDVPILNLQVRLREGKKISMFSQLEHFA
jgi:hypothetical protein